ncbi:type VII secretion target [Micromonospora sp. CA-111912]|uniref:type VII secretion target n=1 Tax=Micromonospora sp. CA-111912 TaxID=3239955 RepID=UPI003D8CD2D9
MQPPSRNQVTVATNTLRSEATEWDGQSATVGGLGSKVAGMELGRVEAGLFQLIVSPYNDVVQQVSQRCDEGKKAMTEVAQTLRKVADTYDEEDRNNAHKIHKLY